jgi:hypothetical protein
MIEREIAWYVFSSALLELSYEGPVSKFSLLHKYLKPGVKIVLHVLTFECIYITDESSTLELSQDCLHSDFQTIYFGYNCDVLLFS